MNFGYRAASSTLRKKKLLVALSLVAIPLSYQPSSTAAIPRDPRAVRLHRFLSKLACPVANMADDFIRVADGNHLDWRLLPSIAVIESGGGKAYKNNNIFGWNRGEQIFPDIKSGLETVGYKLGQSRLYKRHDSLGKLRIYNENEEYADTVMALMNRIGSYN